VLSKKTKYALKSLILLARTDAERPVSAAEIAELEAIPRKFLEQILVELRLGGFLVSRKGKEGGYLLARPAAEITFGQVVRALEGPLALLPCVSQTAYRKCDECQDETSCSIRIVMKKVRDETARILDGTSLTDMLDASHAAVAEALAEQVEGRTGGAHAR